MSVYIVDALRTPIGETGGQLRAFTATDLLTPLLRQLSDAMPEDERLSAVTIGNVRGPGGNPARYATLQAGLPFDVAATTIDRQCGSGLAAVELAVHQLEYEGGWAIAGGTQSASTQPLTFWPAATPDDDPQQFTRSPFAPPQVGDPEMGYAADLLAERYGITRERQDEYSLRSHTRALSAQADGTFASESVPMGDATQDQRPRPLTIQRLQRFHPTFRDGGTVTVANSCGVNDGAAAVLLCDEVRLAKHQRPALKVLSTATTGCDPNQLGLGMVDAVRLALSRASLSLHDVNVFELNEAFAGQVLACLDQLGIVETANCAQGGAIALGHPWGASGAVLLVRLFTQLVRQDAGRIGLAAISIGGGLGTAMVVERC